MANVEQNYTGALDAARKVIAELDRQGVELVSPARQVRLRRRNGGGARARRRRRAPRLLGEIESLPPGLQPPLLRAHALRYRGLLGEDDRAAAQAAAALLDEYSFVPDAALVRLDHAEWLLANGRSDEAQPLLDEARAVFERLGAVPWLERLERLDPQAAVA